MTKPTSTGDGADPTGLALALAAELDRWVAQEDTAKLAVPQVLLGGDTGQVRLDRLMAVVTAARTALGLSSTEVSGEELVKALIQARSELDQAEAQMCVAAAHYAAAKARVELVALQLNGVRSLTPGKEEAP